MAFKFLGFKWFKITFESESDALETNQIFSRTLNFYLRNQNNVWGWWSRNERWNWYAYLFFQLEYGQASFLFKWWRSPHSSLRRNLIHYNRIWQVDCYPAWDLCYSKRNQIQSRFAQRKSTKISERIFMWSLQITLCATWLRTNRS